MVLMSKFNKGTSRAFTSVLRLVAKLAPVLAVICFSALLTTACGKRGDLYLPEEKAEVTTPADKSADQNKEEKKDKKKIPE